MLFMPRAILAPLQIFYVIFLNGFARAAHRAPSVTSGFGLAGCVGFAQWAVEKTVFDSPLFLKIQF